MRAIAAASIVVYHVWLYGGQGPPGLDFGSLTKIFANLRTGVTLFFVLSGFLLFRPYVGAALRGTKRPSTSSYFRNRALRILPAYWFILLFVAIVLERALLRSPAELTANLFFAQNYVPDYVRTLGPGIVPAWSLVIEVVFYLALPLLGALAIVLASRNRFGRIRAAFVPVVLMVVLGIASKIALHGMDGGLHAVWAFSFFAHADWFAAGMALAVLRVLWEDDRLRLPKWWQPAALAGAVGFAVLALALQGRVLNFLEYQTPMAVGCGFLLALVVFAEPSSRFVRFLCWKPVFAAGLASYSLFLWHDPLVRAFRDAGWMSTGRSGMLVNLLLVAVVAGVASALTYRFVEKPALALKRSSFRDVERPAVTEEPFGSLEEGDLKPTPAAVR
jgi:peptidoglycan/LPS O-acetylase OafA/YrhL